MKKQGLRRVTVDLDSRTKKSLLNTFVNIVLLLPNFEYLEVIKSNRKGYHFIIWVNKQFNEQQLFELRRKLGDDKKRIKIDKARGFNLQTLFNEKYEKSKK